VTAALITFWGINLSKQRVQPTRPISKVGAGENRTSGPMDPRPQVPSVADMTTDLVARSDKEIDMYADVLWDLNKLHINDMLREAEQLRLNRQLGAPKHEGSIDAVSFRQRISRLVRDLPAVHIGGSRPASA